MAPPAQSSTQPGQSDGHAGTSAYVGYVSEQLAREDARKESLEKRGLAVITTAGVLATLLFAFAAFDEQKDTLRIIPTSAHNSLRHALWAYFVSAVFAIATNVPLFYAEVKPSVLRTRVKERWTDSKAEYDSTMTRITVLERARRVNTAKAVCLLIAISAQAVGIFFIVKAVTRIL